MEPASKPGHSGVVILTYVLIAYFIVDGILMIILAIAHRQPAELAIANMQGTK